MLSAPVYNRSSKQYEVINPETGEVETFPAKHKHEAFLFAVGLYEPDLYAAAQKIIARFPQLERRVWSAVELVAQNAVTYTPEAGQVVAMVNSSDELGRYAIEIVDGYTTCQCEDFTSFNAPMTDTGHRFCKHILAYRLYIQVRENRF